MLCRLRIKVFPILIKAWAIVFISGVVCYAQEPAKLKNISLQKVDQGLQITLEHSRPPLDVRSQKVEKQLRLYVYIDGARITFRPYQNVPIEIPINKSGVKSIIFEEKIDYLTQPSKSVVLMVEAEQDFDYKINSQWEGQFVRILIMPKEKVLFNVTATEKRREARRLTRIKKIQDKEVAKAKNRLKAFTEEKRKKLIENKSEARVAKIRADAKKRIKEGKSLEESFQKLRTQPETSKLQAVRKEIVENSLYKDVTMPSEIKPVIRKTDSSSKIKIIEDCIRIGLSNYIPVQISKEQQKLAKLRVKEARRAFYPSFLGEWNETDGDTVTEPYRGRSYGFQAEQPLFTGGKLMLTLRKEQLGELIANGNLDKVKQDLIFQISKAYYEVVIVKNSLDHIKILKEKADKILAEVEAEFKIGSATPAVLLTTQSLYNQVYFQLSSAERELALAKLSLEKQMYAENINIEDMDYSLQRKNIDLDLGQCLDLAFRNRPEPKILEKTIKSAKYGEDIIRSEEMPNVSLIGAYGRSGEAFSQRELLLGTEWNVMAKVRWFLGGNTVETSYKKDEVSPYRVTRTDTNVEAQTFNTKFSFWDNLAHFTKRKEAQITRKQAEKDLVEMRNKIRQETEDAYYSYLKYKSQLSLSINEIGFRRKQLEIVKTKRGMNEATGAEQMEAELQLTQANGNYEQAMAGLNVSIVAMNRAIGVINYFH